MACRPSRRCCWRLPAGGRGRGGRARSRDKLALDMARGSLGAMAAGGMHDQLGGGFARYSVDERWLVPHFEKMLYDNAQLARVYVLAWKLSGDRGVLAAAEFPL